MAFTYPIAMLGCTVSGDVGPYTVYTDRFGKKVWFPKSPPKSKPTELQLAVRRRFTTAQHQYMQLSAAEKKLWESLTRKANLCLTGQNLFIHVAMMWTFAMLATIQHQTGITVTPPNPV